MLTDGDRELIKKETGVVLEEEHERNNAKQVLFNILRKVFEQDENRDIRTFYRVKIIKKMNDHVINDWSDGKTCIGLSNETMMKRYRTILQRKYRTDSRFAFSVTVSCSCIEYNTLAVSKSLLTPNRICGA